MSTKPSESSEGALCDMLSSLGLDTKQPPPGPLEVADLGEDELASHMAALDVSHGNTGRYFSSLSTPEVRAILKGCLDSNLRANALDYHKSAVAYAKYDDECYQIVTKHINDNVIGTMRVCRKAQYSDQDKGMFDLGMDRIGVLLKAHGEVVRGCKPFQDMGKRNFDHMIDNAVALIKADWLGSEFLDGVQ